MRRRLTLLGLPVVILCLSFIGLPRYSSLMGLRCDLVLWSLFGGHTWLSVFWLGGGGDPEGDGDCAEVEPGANSYLNIACGLGQRSVAETLIAAGADVNSVCCLDDTPLNAAIASGSVELVQLLLHHGARADLGAPLEHAVIHRSLGAACLLLEHGAPITPYVWAEAKADPTMLELLASGGRSAVCSARTSTSS